MIYTLDLKPIYIGKKKYRLPPSLNNTIHWAQRYKISQEWITQVGWLCKYQKIPRLKKVKLLLRNYSIRGRDLDNLIASGKPIFDGLVKIGVIPDDSPEYVIEVKAENCKVKKRIDESLVLFITTA